MFHIQIRIKEYRRLGLRYACRGKYDGRRGSSVYRFIKRKKADSFLLYMRDAGFRLCAPRSSRNGLLKNH